MARSPEPLFLARESYRRRRLGDAARVIPVLGFILLLLPVLLKSTTGALIFVFSVWAVLILVMAVLSPRLSRNDTSDVTLPAAADDP